VAAVEAVYTARREFESATLKKADNVADLAGTLWTVKGILAPNAMPSLRPTCMVFVFLSVIGKDPAIGRLAESASIFRGLLSAVDNENLHRFLLPFELQSKLFLKNGEIGGFGESCAWPSSGVNSAWNRILWSSRLVHLPNDPTPPRVLCVPIGHELHNPRTEMRSVPKGGSVWVFAPS
jgi:hypothetical protein